MIIKLCSHQLRLAIEQVGRLFLVATLDMTSVTTATMTVTVNTMSGWGRCCNLSNISPIQQDKPDFYNKGTRTNVHYMTNRPIYQLTHPLTSAPSAIANPNPSIPALITMFHGNLCCTVSQSSSEGYPHCERSCRNNTVHSNIAVDNCVQCSPHLCSQHTWEGIMSDKNTMKRPMLESEK